MDSNIEIKDSSIIFPIDIHGKYIIYKSELKYWNKTKLKRLINDICQNSAVEYVEKIALLNVIERQLLRDYDSCKDLYEKLGVNKYKKIAVRCLEIAELCRINGRDKYYGER